MAARPTFGAPRRGALALALLLGCTARAEEDADDTEARERASAPRLAATSAKEPPLEVPEGWDDVAVAKVLLAPVYDTYERPRRKIGKVQRGAELAVRRAPTDVTCTDHGKSGRWYEVAGGYVCAARDYEVGARLGDLPYPQRRPDLARALPFPYVKVQRVDALRYDDPIEDPDAIEEYQTKAYFLAFDSELERGGTRWVRTVYDEYVKASEVRAVDPPTLKGVALSGADDLPVAFVFGPEEGVPLTCGADKQPCGHAEKHSRFSPRRVRDDWVETPDGRFVARSHVRIAKKSARPRGVPAGAKWVHVDLAAQLFVAYEGERPVYTSLVSSGAEGHTTPNGLHRVERKYVTKTMRGPDPKAGRYRVEEIPWVMYYHENFALHGAYWHNQFGEVRSHGCTNIAPEDAKWLFEWGTGTVPPGWHANLDVDDGTWFHLTGGADPE